MDGLWSYERARHVLVTAALTPNIVWDIGGPSIYVSVKEWVQSNGSENICFSAGGMYTTGPIIVPPLLEAIDSEEDKANILGGNLTRLFTSR
jgi:hypothetical protein